MLELEAEVSCFPPFLPSTNPVFSGFFFSAKSPSALEVHIHFELEGARVSDASSFSNRVEGHTRDGDDWVLLLSPLEPE